MTSQEFREAISEDQFFGPWIDKLPESVMSVKTFWEELDSWTNPFSFKAENGMGPKELHELVDEVSDWTFDHYVPNSGPSKYLYGELVRALAKISYRYYNDGESLINTKEEQDSSVQRAYRYVTEFEDPRSSWEVAEMIRDIQELLEEGTRYVGKGEYEAFVEYEIRWMIVGLYLILEYDPAGKESNYTDYLKS